MKELHNIKEAFDALLSHFDEAGIKDNTYEPQLSNVEQAKNRFIEKWNVDYNDTEQELIFAQEMRENLDAIIDALKLEWYENNR